MHIVCSAQIQTHLAYIYAHVYVKMFIYICTMFVCAVCVFVSSCIALVLVLLELGHERTKTNAHVARTSQTICLARVCGCVRNCLHRLYHMVYVVQHCSVHSAIHISAHQSCCRNSMKAVALQKYYVVMLRLQTPW